MAEDNEPTPEGGTPDPALVAAVAAAIENLPTVDPALEACIDQPFTTFNQASDDMIRQVADRENERMRLAENAERARIEALLYPVAPGQKARVSNATSGRVQAPKAE